MSDLRLPNNVVALPQLFRALDIRKHFPEDRKMKHIRIHLPALSAVALLVLAFGATNASGQEAGNRGVYGRSTERKSPSSGVTYGTENKDLVPVQFIEAYVVLNAAPDEFVAVFGAAQEAPTAVESNQKVNAQIEQFLNETGVDFGVLVHLPDEGADFAIREFVDAVAEQPFVLG